MKHSQNSSNLPENSSAQLPLSDTKPLVWAVVLHWRAADATYKCLESLQKVEYENLKILLVDNDSPDKSGVAITNKFPGVELLSLADNLGFAGGCNSGITYCLERKADWIWLLNNDTIISANCLNELMQYALANPQVGVLGAEVFDSEDHVSAAVGPGKIDFAAAKTFLKPAKDQGTELVSCEWVAGSNLLLRSEALKQVGLFDKDYFLYFEDADLCYRLFKNGWRCLFVPSARINHTGGASTTGDLSYWRAYYHTRNRFLFFQKHSCGLISIVGWFSIHAHLLRHALTLPFRGDRKRKQLRAELLGWRDYILKRFGKATCLDWCE